MIQNSDDRENLKQPRYICKGKVATTETTHVASHHSLDSASPTCQRCGVCGGAGPRRQQPGTAQGRTRCPGPAVHTIPMLWGSESQGTLGWTAPREQPGDSSLYRVTNLPLQTPGAQGALTISPLRCIQVFFLSSPKAGDKGGPDGLQAFPTTQDSNMAARAGPSEYTCFSLDGS